MEVVWNNKKKILSDRWNDDILNYSIDFFRYSFNANFLFFKIFLKVSISHTIFSHQMPIF